MLIVQVQMGLCYAECLPSRTELFVYFFKLIPVYYYEYACVCERVDSICMSDWWGDCGGGFTSTREDVNGVEYQVGE